jgi:hypothetical protein
VYTIVLRETAAAGMCYQQERKPNYGKRMEAMEKEVRTVLSVLITRNFKY